MIEFHHPLMDTAEYIELFQLAKKEKPNVYDYFIQVACIDYLQNIKSDIKLDSNTSNEVQEEHYTQ